MREKPAFLGNAWAMLFPIDWPEPFGLVPVMGSGVADRPTADQPVSPVDIGVVLVAEDRDHQALRRPLRWTAYPVPAAGSVPCDRVSPSSAPTCPCEPPWPGDPAKSRAPSRQP